MLGSQDQGGALRRFFTLSGKEPFDSGRQGSCIFPALGLVEGEAKLKAVLLPGLAGGCLGGHAPSLVLQPGPLAASPGGRSHLDSPGLARGSKRSHIAFTREGC